MENTLKIIEKEKFFYCGNCNNLLRAGEQWVLFCPTCKVAEKGFKLPEKIMSCVHCEKPLVMERAKDGRIVGRCYTENCGDCFSLQDLCLVPIVEEKETPKELPEEIKKILEEVKEHTSFDELIMKAREYRKVSREKLTNDKDMWVVLNAILGKIEEIGTDESRLLPPTRKTLVKFLAWTWFEPRK